MQIDIPAGLLLNPDIDFSNISEFILNAEEKMNIDWEDECKLDDYLVEQIDGKEQKNVENIEIFLNSTDLKKFRKN